MYVNVFLLKIKKLLGQFITNLELHSMWKSNKRFQKNCPTFLSFQDLVRKEGIVWKS